MQAAQQQAVRSEITEQESVQMVRSLLKISIYEARVCYLRGIFPTSAFSDISLPALDNLTVRVLRKDEEQTEVETEASRLTQWIEQGVFDAIEKRYLERLFFGFSKDREGNQLLEEYIFTFRYLANGQTEMGFGNASQETFNTAGAGGEAQRAAYPPRCHVDQNSLKFQVLRLIRMLVQMCKTLEQVPDERYIFMKLSYNESAPEEYEPPYFQHLGSECVGFFPFEPFCFELGRVNPGFHKVSLKLKSILDQGIGYGEDPTSVNYEGAPRSDLRVPDHPEEPERDEGAMEVEPTGMAGGEGAGAHCGGAAAAEEMEEVEVCSQRLPESQPLPLTFLPTLAPGTQGAGEAMEEGEGEGVAAPSAPAKCTSEATEAATEGGAGLDLGLHLERLTVYGTQGTIEGANGPASVPLPGVVKGAGTAGGAPVADLAPGPAALGGFGSQQPGGDAQVAAAPGARARKEKGEGEEGGAGKGKRRSAKGAKAAAAVPVSALSPVPEDEPLRGGLVLQPSPTGGAVGGHVAGQRTPLNPVLTQEEVEEEEGRRGPGGGRPRRAAAPTPGTFTRRTGRTAGGGPTFPLTPGGDRQETPTLSPLPLAPLTRHNQGAGDGERGGKGRVEPSNNKKRKTSYVEAPIFQMEGKRTRSAAGESIFKMAKLGH